MAEFVITPEILSGAAGILISLCLTYIPKLNVKWQGLEADYKRLIILASLLVVTVGVFLISCSGVAQWIACDQQGAWQLIKLFVVALIANQSVYPLSVGLDKLKARSGKG